MADPRRARTRQRLLNAGHTLIAREGVSGLRIAAITEEAGVAFGSFYNHFGTRAALVEAVLSDALAAMADEIVGGDPRAEEPPAVVASAAMRRFVRLAYEDPDFAALFVELSHGEALFLDAITPFARTALDRGVQEGVFEIDDVDVAIAAVVSGGLGVVRRILDGTLGPDADVPYSRMTLRGFGLDPAEAARIAELPLPPWQSSPDRTTRQSP
jgi:AcrR family transcriptional regulator